MPPAQEDWAVRDCWRGRGLLPASQDVATFLKKCECGEEKRDEEGGRERVSE